MYDRGNIKQVGALLLTQRDISIDGFPQVIKGHQIVPVAEYIGN